MEPVGTRGDDAGIAGAVDRGTYHEKGPSAGLSAVTGVYDVAYVVTLNAVVPFCFLTVSTYRSVFGTGPR